MSFVQELRVIRWTELGEILQVKKERNKRKDNFSFTQDEIWFIHFLQLLEMVYGEAGVEAPKLNLTFLCDNRFLHFILHLRVKTLPGWRSTSWKCRSVSAQESRSWTSPCSTSPSTTRMRRQLLSWASPAPCTLSLRWKFRGFEEDLPTYLPGAERSWSSIPGWLEDLPDEHPKHVVQLDQDLPQQDDEHLLRDLVRHQDELRVGFCLQMQMHPTPTIQGVWTRWSSTWTTSSWWTSRWRWNRRPRRRSTHPGQLLSPSSLVEW